MGDYETIISIAGFLVISHFVLITAGGGDALFNLPEGTEAPKAFPSPNVDEIEPVDLDGDVFSSSNITFVDSSQLSNPDPAFESGTVAVLESGSDSGNLVYNIPSVNYVETYSTDNCGGFFGDSGLQIGSNQQTTDLDYICAVTKSNVEEANVNFVKFRFDGSGSRTPRLYAFNYSETTQSVSAGDSISGALGVIADIFEGIGDLALYPLRLWDYFEHFPLYIQLFYGTILGYMAVDILQIG